MKSPWRGRGPFPVVLATWEPRQPNGIARFGSFLQRLRRDMYCRSLYPYGRFESAMYQAIFGPL